MATTLQRKNRTNSNPIRPTRALPGTEEKVSVLAQRAAGGQPIFHLEDAVWKESALVAWLREPSEFRTALLRRL